MAGLLDWVMGLVQGPQAQVSGNGVTYGPAVSRLTRTPINFSSALPYGGLYSPTTGAMTVNPNNTNDVNRTVRHESVHALMDKPGVLQAATSGPAMVAVMHSMPRFVGDPAAEAPAYISQNQPGQSVLGSPMTTEWTNTQRNAALAEMLKNVQAKDVSAAGMLQRLSIPPSEDALTAMRTQ